MCTPSTRGNYPLLATGNKKCGVLPMTMAGDAVGNDGDESDAEGYGDH